METETVNIGPTDIAKLLYSLRGTIGEIYEQLIGRVMELGIDNETHARYVVDFLKATEYLEKKVIAEDVGRYNTFRGYIAELLGAKKEAVAKGPRGFDIILYKLTQKGEEFIPQHL